MAEISLIIQQVKWKTKQFVFELLNHANSAKIHMEHYFSQQTKQTIEWIRQSKSAMVLY